MNNSASDNSIFSLFTNHDSFSIFHYSFFIYSHDNFHHTFNTVADNAFSRRWRACLLACAAADQRPGSAFEPRALAGGAVKRLVLGAANDCDSLLANGDKR